MYHSAKSSLAAPRSTAGSRHRDLSSIHSLDGTLRSLRPSHHVAGTFAHHYSQAVPTSPIACGSLNASADPQQKPETTGARHRPVRRAETRGAFSSSPSPSPLPSPGSGFFAKTENLASRAAALRVHSLRLLAELCPAGAAEPRARALVLADAHGVGLRSVDDGPVGGRPAMPRLEFPANSDRVLLLVASRMYRSPPFSPPLSFLPL